MNQPFLERKGYFLRLYFNSLTRRHIGAAQARDTSPATISSCAS
jgi:hypothetical protein